MAKKITRLLCGAAICVFGASADGLTVVATFDSSITSDPNAAAMKAAINGAIAVFETNYTDSLTVFIQYVSDPTVGLGENETWGGQYAYSDFLAALRSRATSVNDANALSQLTDDTFDPVLGGTAINLNLAHARLLGLDTQIGPDGLDSTIYLNMTLMNFTRPGKNPDNYDLQSVVEHEMDEVLGTPSSLPDVTNIAPMDLFRYDTNLNRSFTVNGDNAYFSVDGTNLWARYNMEPYGDYGDWWSDNDIFWAPPGVTPQPQVQDAFADPGVVLDLGINELAALDVIGYTLRAVARPPLKLSIVHSGLNQITISWPGSIGGFSLEERTNLNTGVWRPSASGTLNPAVIDAPGAQKFYRLVGSVGLIDVVARAVAVQRATEAPYRLRVHFLQARP